MASDRFQAPDYYLLDELLTEEHKLIRDTVREWVKKDVSPIIEEAAQKGEYPIHLNKGIAELGGFGPYIPTEVWWCRVRPNFLWFNYAGI